MWHSFLSFLPACVSYVQCFAQFESKVIHLLFLFVLFIVKRNLLSLVAHFLPQLPYLMLLLLKISSILAHNKLVHNIYEYWLQPVVFTWGTNLVHLSLVDLCSAELLKQHLSQLVYKMRYLVLDFKLWDRDELPSRCAVEICGFFVVVLQGLLWFCQLTKVSMCMKSLTCGRGPNTVDTF